MKAARIYAAKDVRIENIELGEIKNDEVKIEVEWCGICGSDKHMYVEPFMEPLPMTLGHEFSGRVVEIGSNVTKVKVGDRVVVNPLVTCGKCINCRRGYPNLCENIILFGYHGIYGGFAEYTLVKEDMVVNIPDKLSFDKAALVEPAAVATHALRTSQFKVGDRVAVFGAGPIGLFLISALKVAGASQILVIAHTEARRQLAQKLGATRVIDPDKENVTEIIKEMGSEGIDVVYETSGAQQSFTLGLSILRARGEMVIISLPQKELYFDAAKILQKEIRIITSQCSNDEFPVVVKLLAEDMLNVEGIITKKIHLEDLVQEGFDTLLKDKSQIKILVTPKRENLRKE